jgi:hypothetical protein
MMPDETMMAVDQAEAAGAQIGQQYLEGTMQSLDQAESPKEVIDAIRGNEQPLEARYQELAGFVGEADARQTPETVLALVQPTIMMTEEGAMGTGIAQLMQQMVGDVDMGGTDMGQGVGSLMMAGASEAPAPQNFNQGGAVAYLKNGSDDSGTAPLNARLAGINTLMESFGSLAKPPSAETVAGYYQSLLPMYQKILGEDEEAKRASRAGTFFDIAQAGLNLAAGVDPRTGQSVAGQPFASQLAAAASQLPAQISARDTERRTAERVVKATALETAMQQAQGEQNFRQAIGTTLAKDLFGTQKAYSPFTLYRPDGSDFATVDKNDPNFETKVSEKKKLGFTSTKNPIGSTDKGYSPFTLYKPDGSDFTTVNKNDPKFETKVAEKKELGFTSTSDPAGDDEAYSVFTLYKPDGSDFTTIDKNDPNFETKVAEQKELGFTTPDKPAGEGDASPFFVFNAEGENMQIDKNLGSEEFERRLEEAKGLGFTLTESPDLSLFGNRAVGKARARSTEEGFEELLFQHIFVGNRTPETRVAVDDLLLLLQPVEGSTTPGQVRPELQIYAALIQPGAENLLAEVQQAVAINPTGTQAAVGNMQQTLTQAKKIATDIMLGNNKTDDLANDIELLIDELAEIELREATGLPSLVTNVAETVAQQFADVMDAPIQSKITSDTKEARRLLETYQIMAQQFFFQAPEQDRPLSAQYDDLMRRFPQPEAGELDSDAMQRVRNLGALFRNNENYYRDVLRNPNLVATGRTLDSSRKRLRQAQMLAELSEAMVLNYERGPSGQNIVNQAPVGNLNQRMLQYIQ